MMRLDADSFEWPSSREEVHALVPHILVMSPQVDTAKSMLKAGADPLIVLIEASCNRADDIVAYLLESDPTNLRSRMGSGLAPESQYTALMSASEEGNVRTVRLLLEAGASPLVRHPEHGMTAAWVASDHGRVDILRCLVAAGADVNVPKIQPGMFHCSHVAAQNGHVEVLLVLLAGGANPNQLNKFSCSPLLQASCFGKVSALAALLKHGADVPGLEILDNKAFMQNDPKLDAATKDARRALFEGCADPRTSLRRLAKCVLDYHANNSSITEGLSATSLLTGKLLPPVLRFRLLFAASRYLEVRAQPQQKGKQQQQQRSNRDALACAISALQLANNTLALPAAWPPSTTTATPAAAAAAARAAAGVDVDVDANSNNNKHDAAAAWLLETYCVPRLSESIFGPKGSDSRAVLLQRQAPSKTATKPPDLIYCAHFNWGGKAWRFGGQTFSSTGHWKVEAGSSSQLWCFDPVAKGGRAFGGDGSMDPWRLVRTSSSSSSSSISSSNKNYSSSSSGSNQQAPSPRFGMACALVGADTVVVWGGEFGQLGASRGCDPRSYYLLDFSNSEHNNDDDANNKVNTDGKSKAPVWTKVESKGKLFPEARANMSCVGYRGCLFVFGGTSAGQGSQSTGKHNDLWRLDLAKKKWFKVKVVNKNNDNGSGNGNGSQMPAPRSNATMWAQRCCREDNNGKPSTVSSPPSPAAVAPPAAPVAAEAAKAAEAAEAAEKSKVASALTDPDTLSVKEIRAECKERGLSTAGCSEKSEFVALIRNARAKKPASTTPSATAAATAAAAAAAAAASASATAAAEGKGDEGASLFVGGGGILRVFGGEVFPGERQQKYPGELVLDPELGCVSTGDFFALTLSEDMSCGKWEEVPVLGDHPGPLQEINAMVLPYPAAGSSTAYSTPSTNASSTFSSSSSSSSSDSLPPDACLYDTTSASQHHKVVLFGGYRSGRLQGKGFDLARARHGITVEPYCRDLFVFEAGVWRLLERIGDDHVAKCAQTWLLPVPAIIHNTTKGGEGIHNTKGGGGGGGGGHGSDWSCSTYAARGSAPGSLTFFAVGGYGLTAQTKSTTNGPFGRSVHPEILHTWYHCTLHDVDACGVSGVSVQGVVSGGGGGGGEGGGGGVTRVRRSSDVFANGAAFAYSLIELGGSYAASIASKKAASDDKKKKKKEAAAAAGIDDEESSAEGAGGQGICLRGLSLQPVEGQQPPTIEKATGVPGPFPVMWAVKRPPSDGSERDCMTNLDTYRGPVAPDVLAALDKIGWDRKSVFFSPPFKGPLFEPAYPLTPRPKYDKNGKEVKKKPSAYEVMAKLCAEHKAKELPKAQAHAAKLSEVRPKPGVARLTLHVAVVGIASPVVWRRVRVAATMTLAQFHDKVLCPVFGYTPNYHSYAFRSSNSSLGGKLEPWLGPSKGSSLDMAHVPFFIKAMGSDRKVQLCSLLDSVGSTATYVHDLGDWVEHVIRLEQEHGEEEEEEDGDEEGCAGDGGGGGGGGSTSSEIGAACSSPSPPLPKPPPKPPSSLSFATDSVAKLLGGECAGLPEDVGSPAEFVSKVNQALGITPHPDFKDIHTGKTRAVPPEHALWWTHLNSEFRKKNSKGLVFNPWLFDLDGCRFDLNDALRSENNDARDAAHSFVASTFTGGADSVFDSNANATPISPKPSSNAPPRSKKNDGRKTGSSSSSSSSSADANKVEASDRRGGGSGESSAKAAALCAVCGSTVALRACSRCRQVHYCSPEHQKTDWKAHKPVCRP